MRLRSFIEHEFDSIDLGDERLNKRSRQILGDLYCAPGESYLSACDDWAGAKGAYRFIENEAVTTDKLLEAHRPKLIERCHDEKEILCIGDTTEICIKRPRTKGLGPLNYDGRRGFLMHPLWIVNPERLPLGIAEVRSIIRSDEELGRKHGAYRDVPLEKRESAKWCWSLEATSKLRDDLGTDAPLVTAIFDREGDIFRVLSTAVTERDRYRLIVRAVQKRQRADKIGSPKVWEDLASQPLNDRITLEVQAGRNRKQRTAVLALRWAKVVLKPPRVRAPAGAAPLSEVEVYAIHVVEENPPSKSDRIEWKLFTTMPVTSLGEAKGCIDRYACRWSIEWLFRTLKSGGAEDRQFRSAAKLEKTIVQDMIVSFMVIYISMIRRVRPDQPCTRVFRESEWQALWTYLFEEPLPDRPPSIEEMIEFLGMIGGYPGRKGDSPPGPKVFRRAFTKLPAIERMWLIANR